MKELPQISEAEYEVMKVIWDYAPISTNAVVEKLSASSNWSPKTIQTMLIRLKNKGALSYYKEGRVFVYTPIVKKEDYLVHKSDNFLSRFYNGTLNSMVLNFLENDKLSDDEEDELYRILQQRRKKD